VTFTFPGAASGRRRQIVAKAAVAKRDTVTLALQRVSEDARARRASALHDLLATADADGLDYDRLDDLDQ
jgi:hypothetical protein